MKIFGVLSILLGVISVLMSIVGVEAIYIDGFSKITVSKSFGIVEDAVSILMSVALIVGGYAILRRVKWAYWYVHFVMLAVVFVFIAQGAYLALTFESVLGGVWGLVSQWLIAWLIFHFMIRRYWQNKKEYFSQTATNNEN